jgi:hypothetical protein
MLITKASSLSTLSLHDPHNMVALAEYQNIFRRKEIPYLTTDVKHIIICKWFS